MAIATMRALVTPLPPKKPFKIPSRHRNQQNHTTITPRASPSSRNNNNHNQKKNTDDIPDTLPVIGADTDWRTFRARLVASTAIATTDDPWAHSIPAPETGALLLASPLLFHTTQQYFRQSVILLVEHSPHRGSVGLILNKPTQHRVSRINASSPASISSSSPNPDPILPIALNPCILYMGGDVRVEGVNIIHSIPGVKGAEEILPGVWWGGFQGVGAAVEERARQARLSGATSTSTAPHCDDIRVIIGCAGWGPGQLEDEVARGAWHCAAASRHAVMATGGAGEEHWHMVMQMMGGEYAGLSAAMKEEYRPDIMHTSSSGGGPDNSTGTFGTHSHLKSSSSGAGADADDSMDMDGENGPSPSSWNSGSGI